jgi:threonine/homoserine/homoserine lactone efflux protein
MSPDLLAAMASFAFVTSFTPGPNNIMLTASGANFGFARSMPHIAGVVIGFSALIAAAGAGLGAALIAFPAMQTVLKVLGAAYMLWLAWKIANARPSGNAASAEGRPLTFLQAAAFQWVNPKGLVTALGAIALYVRPERASADLSALLAIFAVAAAGSTAAWAGFGAALSRALRDGNRARMFNAAMALLLVASILPMVL